MLERETSVVFDAQASTKAFCITERLLVKGKDIDYVVHNRVRSNSDNHMKTVVKEFYNILYSPKEFNFSTADTLLDKIHIDNRDSSELTCPI